MIQRRTRTALWALVFVAAIWVLGILGYRLGISSRVTAEKVSAFLHSHDLGSLSRAERAEALRLLADKINGLTPEERRRIREEQRWKEWLAQLTDQEKEELITATFPTGIKQIMTAFEQLTENQRQRMVDDALGRLKETGELRIGDHIFDRGDGQSTNRNTGISPEMAEKIREVGLRTFFAESSAQMKVEAAPLLEEIQHQMESGGWGRHGSR